MCVYLGKNLHFCFKFGAKPWRSRGWQETFVAFYEAVTLGSVSLAKAAQAHCSTRCRSYCGALFGRGISWQ